MEMDMSAIREEAKRSFRMAVIGEKGCDKEILIKRMKTDPRERKESVTSVVSEYEFPLGEDDYARLNDADLAIIVLDASREECPLEVKAFERLRERGVPILVCYYVVSVQDSDVLPYINDHWPEAQVISVTAADHESLSTDFAPAVLDALSHLKLALARQLPLFREPVAARLIEETSFTNATYALGAGLAKMIPALHIPLNVADFLVLTKNQAVMAYKIALIMGVSARWRDVIPELASVVGAGFIWRQIARGLVGLIPGWGIIPKVAVAYAGTYVIGRAVYIWYATGEKLRPDQVKGLYKQALARGKMVARALLKGAEKKGSEGEGI